ncbi:MAG TPA: amidinotransferase [Acidobacteriaceae bacterium]
MSAPPALARPLATRVSLPFSRPTFLMCPPDYYDVRYVINPWMEGNISRSSLALAVEQWEALHAALSRFADVLVMEPQPGSPDMVFAANAGLVREGKVVLSSFLHPERQDEEEHFRAWFAAAGYQLLELPRDTPFEGEGDALFTADGAQLWAGHGWRTSEASLARLGTVWPAQVQRLQLVDPRFYHVDTCFCPLANGDAMYFPGAFDSASLARIEAYYPPAKRVLVEEEDAAAFACNAVNLGATILLNRISRGLRKELEGRGFLVVETPLSEFLKAGGAAKCLVLRLSELEVTHAASERIARTSPLTSPLTRLPDQHHGHTIDEMSGKA